MSRDEEAEAPRRPRPPARRRLLVRVARTLLLVWLGALVMIYAFQRHLVYHPTERILQTPADRGLDFEDVHLDVGGGQTIHAWWVPRKGARGVALFCHGNAGNLGNRVDTIHDMHLLDLAVLAFDYRGFGKSDGKPGEQETYDDVRAAWKWLVETRGEDPRKIIVWGRSLGGAVAIDLAAEHTPAALIVESTFTSAVDMGRRMFPWLPVSWLARIRYDSASKIDRVSCPKLFMHSRRDDIVPWELGRELFEAAPEPKRFLELRGNHNNAHEISRRGYRKAVRTLLDEALP